MRGGVVFIAAAAVALLVFASAYAVDEREQAVITRFGEPVGTAQEPGLHFKVPFIDVVHRMDKRILEWDGDPNEIPTKDNKFIWVDTFARWRIVDPKDFYISVHDRYGAITKLNDILDGLVRDNISTRYLIEVVRSSDRKMSFGEEVEAFMEEIQQAEAGEAAITSESAVGARNQIVGIVLTQAQEKLQELNMGMELIDFKIKRLNYVDQVRDKVYARMISLQERIAEKYRAQGQGNKEQILGEIDQRRKEIISAAYKEAQVIRGKADARAARIYANAYKQDEEFYRFTKSLETYRQTVDKQSTLILSTDSDYFKYLKQSR